MNKKSSLQNLVSRVADRLAFRGDSSALLAEEKARPLVIEALEPRILFSGSPAPAEPAPAESNTVQEAPAPAESDASADAAPAEEATVAAPPEATVPAPEGAEQGETSVALTDAELSSLTDAAAGIWAGSGISEAQGAALASATYQIADLGGNILGRADGNVITIDDDGAGRGWFVDDTPLEGGAASTGIDLLSVLLHEQGHLLGLDDSGAAAGDIMFEVFGEGERRSPLDGQADGAVAGSLEGVHFAVTPSLTATWQSTIASEQHPDYAGEARYYHVSVNPNNPGIGSFASTTPGTNTPAGTFTRPFTDPVVAYSFLGGTNNSVSGEVKSSGSRISWATSDTTFDGFGQAQLKFWDTTDPGADIATGGADPYNVSSNNGGGGGYRSFGGAVTTIDISGLGSGSVYAFYGAFNSTPTLTAVMRDTDGSAPDILLGNAHLNGDAANRTEYYAAEIEFVTNGGVYDQIEYTWIADPSKTIPGNDYGGNGRGAGAVLTGIPPTAGPTVLLDEGFQDPILPNGTANPGFAGWTYNDGASVKSRINPGQSDVPVGGGNQLIQFEWNSAEAKYDISHNWAAGEAFTLSLNASPQSWNGAADRFIAPRIVEDDGTVLWSANDLMPKYNNFGGNPWTPEQTFEWVILADNFSGAGVTEGSSIRLELDHTGQRGIYVDNVKLTVGDPPADATAPTPDPLTWAVAPTVGDYGVITMTATNASDPAGVEYYFENTTAGTNSGWQDSATWTEGGLDHDTSYTYRAQARDKSGNANTGGWTPSVSATTPAVPEGTIIATGFQAPAQPNNTHPAVFGGWTFAGGNPSGDQVWSKTAAGTNDVQYNVAGSDAEAISGANSNQLIQFTWTSATASHDIAAGSWEAADELTLSLNASAQSWNGHQQRNIDPSIYDGNTLLWSASEEIPLYSGPRGEWTPDQTFEFSISAQDLIDAGATEGEELTLRLSSSGDQRGIYVDNVLLTATIPFAAVDDDFTTDEDNGTTGDILANDSPTNAVIVGINGTTSLTGTSAAGAPVTVNPNGVATYDPNGLFENLAAGETATDTFTYTITPPSAAGTADVSSGLVAHWEFDDVGLSSASGSGAVKDSATSESGDATDDGTLQGGATTSGAANVAFIGTGGLDMINANDGDRVVIDGSPESDFDFAGAGESMSVQTWMRTDPGFDDNWEALVAKGEGSGWRLHRDSGSGSNLSWDANGSAKSSGVNVNDNDWHHVLTVHDGTAGQNYIYIDGILRGSSSGGQLQNRSNFMMIGDNPDSNNREFDGAQDDVGIWNRAVTAEEIAALNGLGRFSKVDLQDSGINDVLNVVAAGSGLATVGSETWQFASGLVGAQGTTGGTVADGDAFIVIDAAGNGVRLYAAADVSSGLVAHWEFDDVGLSSASGSGAVKDSATSESGDATDDGTLQGGATTSGAANVAFIGTGGLDMINANDGDRVVIDGSPESDFDFAGAGESMSVQTWMRTDPGFDDNWEALVAKGEGSGWRLHRDSGSGSNLSWDANGSAKSSGVNVNDNDWHHVLTVHDGTAGQNYIYIDGILRGSSSGGQLQNRSNFMMIGDNPDSNNREFDGAQDDVGIWNRAVTAEEIAALNGLGRFSKVDLQDSGINDVLDLMAAGGGVAVVGSEVWTYASGLSGPQGTTGGTVADGDAFIVIDNAGNGVRLATTDEATVTITVIGVNDAPLLGSPTNNFNDVAVNDLDNDGESVADLLNGQATDVDDDTADADIGIAITGSLVNGAGGGKFQYSLDGTNWLDLPGGLTDDTAFLLDADDRVRFVPDGTNTQDGWLDFRAWDRSDGLTAGNTADADPNGGTAHFSGGVASRATVAVANLILDGDDLIFTATAGTENDLRVSMVGGELVIVDANGHTMNSGPADMDPSDNGLRVTYTPGQNLTIEANSENDAITLGDMTGFTGSLTILGGDGFDEVVVANGASVSLGADEDLLVDGETFRADLDSSVSVLGDGTIDILAAGGSGDFAGLNLRRASLSSEGGGITLTGVGGDTGNTNDGVVLTHGSTVTTGGGSVTITGTATSTTGANDGISLKGGSDITAGGAGGITLTGTSGGVNSSYGVQLFSGTEVTTAGGDIAIVGSSDAVGSRNAGIYTNGATVTAGGAGSVAMTGTGGGAGSNNNGLSLAATAVDAGTSGDVTLVGMGGGGTSGNGGVQVGTRTSVSADGGNVTITGTGGAGTGVRNTGVSLLSGSSVSSGGDTEITGVAGTGTSRNAGVVLVSATVAATGDLTVDGTGNGTGSNNSGISSSRSTLGGAEVTLAGTGSTSSTTGRFNDGVSISRGGVTATGTLTIDAAGGTGSRDNRGLMVSRAALAGTLDVTGSADTDSGARSTGVFIQNSVLSDDGTIAGTGGGVDGVDGFGVYMRNITGGANLGVTTTPDTDEEKGGNFFDAVLPAFLLLGAGGRTKARRRAVGASVLDDELQGRIGAAWGGIRGEARTADALRTQSRLGASLLG